MNAIVTAVCSNPEHALGKPTRASIRLIENHGVDGDAHAGSTIQHRSRLAKNATEPNPRQVHLIHSELHAELRAAGFQVGPGVMGENLTTQGLDLLALPTRARLAIGSEAIVEVTGLRNPCVQLDQYQDGLMQAVLARNDDGELIRKCGIMAVVVAGGDVLPGDSIRVVMPDPPHHALVPV